METSTYKHWENGHQIRGGWFHTYNFIIKLDYITIGVMLSWGHKTLPKLKFFKLV